MLDASKMCFTPGGYSNPSQEAALNETCKNNGTIAMQSNQQASSSMMLTCASGVALLVILFSYSI